MRTKTIGAVLMILGTSIGAGMIALPVAAAQENYFMSIGLLFVSWLIMAFGAFALLEVNLWFGKNTNIITMAGHTLGKPGKIVAWCVYLLLLYSLLCAYISGISDVVYVLLKLVGIISPRWLDILIAVIGLGYVIYRGIQSVDIMNRLLMFTKFLIYGVIVLLLSGKISMAGLHEGGSQFHFNALMVMVTSFGFATIIPSLVDYLDRDSRRLHKVVLWGSIIPMIIYAIWIAIIQGVIPRSELLMIGSSSRTVADLLSAMTQHAGIAWLAVLANIFISICAFTSFLGVSLCMVDFLADGIKVDKTSRRGLLVYVLTFIPPVLIVIFYPNIFIKGLSYAGICCIILLIILPLLMLLSGRYRKKYHHPYRVPGGWISVVIGLIAAIMLLMGLVV